MTRLSQAAASLRENAAHRTRRVLFLVQEHGHFREHIKLARALLATRRYEAQFAISAAYARVEADEAVSLRESIPFHFERPVARRKPFRRRFMEWIAQQKARLEDWLIAQGSPLPAPSSDPKSPGRHFLDLLFLALALRIWHARTFCKLRRGLAVCLGGPWIALAKWADSCAPSPLARGCTAVQNLLRKIQCELSNWKLSALDLVTIPVALVFRPVSRFLFNSVLFAYDVTKLLILKLYVLPLQIFVFYIRRMRKFRRLLRQQQIDVVVLAEDNVGHGTGAYTRAAAALGLPIVTIPYTIANTREFAESYFEVPEHQIDRWPNWWARKLCPQFVHEHRGRKLMRLPGWHALAQQWLKLAPANPWAYNSGRSTAIIVDSEHAVQYYRRAGLTQEPLLPLGALFDDELAHVLADAPRRRRAVEARYGLPHDKPLLLCALPPDQLSSRPQCPFIDFEELVRAWLFPLSRLNSYNVVVSLHPRLNRHDFQWIEREYGICLTQEPTSDLVPLCDVYLASVSATIRWAIACGRPVINYDVFEYNYDDYEDAPGVATVFKQREYEALLRRLSIDDSWRNELGMRQAEDMHRWGKLDGRAAERIVALFDEFCGITKDLDHANGRHRPRPHGPTAPSSRDLQAA